MIYTIIVVFKNEFIQILFFFNLLNTIYLLEDYNIFLCLWFLYGF